MPNFSLEEVSHHNTETDCWVAIDGGVYNLTPFLSEHPGGKRILLKYAGKDASKPFKSFHKPHILQKYGPNLKIGDLSGSSTVGGVQVKSEGGQMLNKFQKDKKGFGENIPFGDPYWYSGGPNPYYKETHHKFRAQVRKFVEEEIKPYVEEWDEKGDYPKELHEKAYNSGLLGSCWPEKYGGTPPEDFDYFHNLILFDELGRCGSGGIVVAIFLSVHIALPPILNVGSDYLKNMVAKDIITGKKIIALAITEPYAGSDVANIQTTARREGDFFIVNGEKKFISCGIKASYYTTAVRTGGPGMGGISLLLIPKDSPGVTARRMKTQGWWCSNTAYITFEDVKVPVKNMIGKENRGFQAIMLNFNHERFMAIVGCVRGARTLVEESIKYARQRRTFGKRLIDHQVIRHKIAEMSRQVEAAHAWMEQIAYQVSQGAKGRDVGGKMALLKVHSSKLFEFCAREASQIFGGASYVRGGVGGTVERIYREVRVNAIGGGSEEVLRDLSMRQAQL